MSKYLLKKFIFALLPLIVAIGVNFLLNGLGDPNGTEWDLGSGKCNSGECSGSAPPPLPATI